MPLTIHDEARTELVKAIADYEALREGLGREFRVEFETAIQKIQDNPYRFAAEDKKGRRRCPLKRFPYHIVYIDFGSHIWIAAVPHNRRRPKYWNRRRPN
jgi:plasmid stabilization system protein ParE